MKITVTAVFALVLMAMTGVASAVEPSGKVIAVVQSANIDGATGQKVIEPEAPVFSGDRVDTGPVGEAQIRFADDTKLVVGPNSSLVIDAFVFDSSGNATKFTINTVKGAFRFITGNSPKDAYQIITPTSTIGVRGTEFDVSVEREGTTRVANFEGVTKICRRVPGTNQTSNCVETEDPCTLSVVRPTAQDIVQYGRDDIPYRNRQLKYYFRYVRNQSNLLKDFQVDLKSCQLAEFIPGSPSPPGPPGPPPPDPPVDPNPPPKPGPPTVNPPPPPSPGGRDHDRPVYDHGPVFRP